MEMKERIAKIIASEGLTQSKFAESIGASNAAITFILTDQRRASLDIITKILAAYPKYNTDWLVLGKGEIYKQPVQTTIFDAIGEPEPEVAQPEVQAADSVPFSAVLSENSAPEPPQTSIQSSDTFVKQEELIEKPLAQEHHATEVKQIIVLYSDGTFTTYNKR